MCADTRIYRLSQFYIYFHFHFHCQPKLWLRQFNKLKIHGQVWQWRFVPFRMTIPMLVICIWYSKQLFSVFLNKATSQPPGWHSVSPFRFYIHDSNHLTGQPINKDIVTCKFPQSKLFEENFLSRLFSAWHKTDIINHMEWRSNMPTAYRLCYEWQKAIAYRFPPADVSGSKKTW